MCSLVQNVFLLKREHYRAIDLTLYLLSLWRLCYGTSPRALVLKCWRRGRVAAKFWHISIWSHAVKEYELVNCYRKRTAVIVCIKTIHIINVTKGVVRWSFCAIQTKLYGRNRELEYI